MTKIAPLIHELWKNWMKHLETRIIDQTNFPIGTEFKGFYFKKDDIDHWKRQMETNYEDLSGKEKRNIQEIANNLIKEMKKID